MFDHALSPGEVERIRQARQEADSHYNDALTRLDAALGRAAALPGPPPLPDEEKLPAINDNWRILAAPRPNFGAGWRARVASFIWRLVGPIFERQQHFNACLVDHLNRNIAGERRSREALGEALVGLRDLVDSLTTFHSRLIQFLQQITAYVDTKDRAVAAGVLRDPHEQISVLEKSIALIQQHQVALRRDVARLGTIVPTAGAQAPATPVLSTDERGWSDRASVDAYWYLRFEDEFRGQEQVIRRRLEEYVRYFERASNVLDVGCGRGEFLEALRAAGVASRGIDTNREMVEACRARGLDATEADAVAYLERAQDGSLGGLFAAQVVEHFDAAYLMKFLDLAYEKLRPGSNIVLETINVDCWSAFFGPFLRDITHARALPSHTLRFLLQASGFQRLQVIARSPVAETSRLRRISPAASEMMPDDAAAALNANIDTLNNLLFTHFDYAIVGER